MTRYKEKKLQKVDSLKKLIRSLDLDEGIRINATYPDLGNAFVFVTKMGNEYRVEVTERVKDKKSGRFVPGSKQELFTFPSYEETWKFVDSYKKKPLEAWYY